jgi:hypothetical protein
VGPARAAGHAAPARPIGVGQARAAHNGVNDGDEVEVIGSKGQRVDPTGTSGTLRDAPIVVSLHGGQAHRLFVVLHSPRSS